MQLTSNAHTLSPDPDDGRLVAAARRGDDRAFEQLYARYRQRIHAFILSKVRDHGRAEDIAQDVFMSALRQMRASDQDLAFKPWLYTIARNACIDEFRRGARGAEVPVHSEEDLDASAAAGPLLCAVPTPAAAIESKQKLEDLRGAFEGLTDSQHQLLVLREFEGRSYDEIGDRLGMTRQMVESGLFRARRKLTEEYDELASGRRCEQIQTAIDAGTLQVARGMGIRDRRRYARHLAHCQPCRHVALMMGVDDTLLTPRRLVDKVAVLLPFPFVRRFFGHGGAAHAGATGTAAQVASVATGAGASLGAAPAMTIAALAVAGAGGGLLATHVVTVTHRSGPAIRRTAAVSAPTGTAVAVVDRSAALAPRRTTATVSHRRLGQAVIPSSALHRRTRATAVRTTRAGGSPPSSTERNRVATTPTAPPPTATAPTTAAPTATTTRTLTTTVPTAPRSTTTATRTTPTATIPTVSTPSTATATTPVQTTVAGAAGAVNGTAGAVASTVNNTVAATGSAVDGTVAATGSAVDGTVAATGSAVNGAVNAVGSTVDGVTTGLSGGDPAAATSTAPATPVSSTVDGVTGVVAGATDGVTGVVTGATDGVTGTVTHAVGGLLGTASTGAAGGS